MDQYRPQASSEPREVQSTNGAGLIEPRQYASSARQTGIISNDEVVIGVSGKLDAESLKWMVMSQGQVSNVSAVCEIEELITAVRSGSPKIVLLDEDIAVFHLQEIARQLPVRLGQTRVAVFADRLSCRQIDMAISYVTAFLSHRDSSSTFLSDLQAAAKGQKVVSKHLESRIRLNVQRNEFELLMADKITRLTNRQIEVLTRIAQGMSAKRVAGELHITEKAVESHKYRLMKTLKLPDRVQLCRWAIREGIIPA